MPVQSEADAGADVVAVDVGIDVGRIVEEVPSSMMD